MRSTSDFFALAGPLAILIFPTKAECLGKLHGEGLFPVKLAEDSFTGRVDWPWTVNRVLSSMDASQDDPLAVKMAEGMRSTSARDALSFGYFSLGK